MVEGRPEDRPDGPEALGKTMEVLRQATTLLRGLRDRMREVAPPESKGGIQTDG